MLHEGAKITYVGWLTREGRKKQASSLVVEFTTKYHANRVTREGLVLNAIHHDCVLYDKSCRLKQCYRYHESGHIDLGAMPKSGADTAQESTTPKNAW